MTTRRRSRAAALLAGGAFAVHQLRYLIGYGDGAHTQLGHQGHAYMTALAPFVAVLLLLVAADVGARLVAGRADGGVDAARLGFARLWALAGACLLGAYAAQETLEGVLSPGHPAGAGAVFAHRGWAALPLAAAIGLVLALVARGAEHAIDLAAEPAVCVARPRPRIGIGMAARRVSVSGRRFARHLGGRSPPLASVG